MKWAITIVRSSSLTSEKPAPSASACNHWTPTQLYTISDKGVFSWSWDTGLGFHGSAPEQMTPESFAQLEVLLASLPDGPGRLPPPLRRLVIQGVTQAGITVHVYDTAQLPDSVLEILRKVRADTWPITEYPDFPPEQRWTAAAFHASELHPSFATPSEQKADWNGDFAFYASADGRHGVAALPGGEIALVDLHTHTKLALIDPGASLLAAVFSPDGNKVATVTSTSQSTRLRIWKVADGTLVHELRPEERSPRPGLGRPVWLPGGDYLFAPMPEGAYGSKSVVGIWNVPEGRYRGALAGCTSVPTPSMTSALVGDALYERCSDGEVLQWNVHNAITSIQASEASLSK